MSTPERQLVDAADPSSGLPRAFGDYLLLHQLGRGGMGEVYLAKTGGIAGIEKLCVVKTLRGDLTADPEYKQRFIDEARVVVQLGHRNICHVFDVGRVAHNYYLAMEHVAGRDVRAILRKAWDLQYSIPRDVMVYLVCEVLEALDYAHRLKDPLSGAPLHVVHRDVSPQNVMVNFEGEVKLIDFGLAQSTMKIERTAPRIVMGKLSYMPPEQARGHDVDGRVDQFAVGVMAYEAITGRSFYEGQTAEQVWMLAGRGGFRPEFFTQLDPALQAILNRALNVVATERYPTCQQFRRDLTRFNLDQGSMAGAHELRELMDALFYDDVNTDRSLLQRFANVKPLDPRPREESRKEKTERIATAVVKREDLGLGPAEQSQTESGPSEPEDPATLPGTSGAQLHENDDSDGARLQQEPTQIVRSDDPATQLTPSPIGPPTERVSSLSEEATQIKEQPAEPEMPTEQADDPTEQLGNTEQAKHLGGLAPPRDEQTQVVRDRSRPDVEVLPPPPAARKSLVPMLVAALAFTIVVSVGAVILAVSGGDQDLAVEPHASSTVVLTQEPAQDAKLTAPVDEAPADEAPADEAPADEAPVVDKPATGGKAAPTAKAAADSRLEAQAKAHARAKAKAKAKAKARAKARPPPFRGQPTVGARVAYLKKHCMTRQQCAPRVVSSQFAAISGSPDDLEKWKNALGRCVSQCGGR